MAAASWVGIGGVMHGEAVEGVSQARTRRRGRRRGELTLPEAMLELGVGYATIYQWVVVEKRVPYRRPGYTYFITEESLERLRSMPRRPRGKPPGTRLRRD